MTQTPSPPVMRYIIADNVRRKALDADLTQTQIAELLRAHGIVWSQQTVSQALNGQRKLSLVDAWALALVLDCTVEDFLTIPKATPGVVPF